MAHIAQGGMADDWWESAPGKIAAPPVLSWESGAKNCGDLSGIYTVCVRLSHIHSEGWFNAMPATEARQISGKYTSTFK